MSALLFSRSIENDIDNNQRSPFSIDSGIITVDKIFMSNGESSPSLRRHKTIASCGSFNCFKHMLTASDNLSPSKKKATAYSKLEKKTKSLLS